MTRLIVLSVLVTTLMGISGARAQAPGQIPGTLPPAVAPVPPPPPPEQVAPRPVPSVVTPLPSPSYGVPPGMTRPVIGGSSPLQVHGAGRLAKKHMRRRHHVTR